MAVGLECQPGLSAYRTDWKLVAAPSDERWQGGGLEGLTLRPKRLRLLRTFVVNLRASHQLKGNKHMSNKRKRATSQTHPLWDGRSETHRHYAELTKNQGHRHGDESDSGNRK